MKVSSILFNIVALVIAIRIEKQILDLNTVEATVLTMAIGIVALVVQESGGRRWVM